MLNIAVCDDDRVFLGRLEELLYDIGSSHEITCEIDVFENGEGLVKKIRESVTGSDDVWEDDIDRKLSCYYDMIFLDMQMKEMDGIETARQLRVLDHSAALIYVTAYESYMKAAFEVMPSGYILKPLIRKDVEETFLRVLRFITEQDVYYRFRYNKIEYKIPVCDIYYFMSDNKKVHIIWRGGKLKEYGKLADVRRTVEKSRGIFLQTHQSYLVNYRHIIRAEDEWVELDNGERIPVSRKRKKQADRQIRKLMTAFRK